MPHIIKQHTKLLDGDAYNFATCFICKQVGHLSKACPDNPKGLYPQEIIYIIFIINNIFIILDGQTL